MLAGMSWSPKSSMAASRNSAGDNVGFRMTLHCTRGAQVPHDAGQERRLPGAGSPSQDDETLARQNRVGQPGQCLPVLRGQIQKIRIGCQVERGFEYSEEVVVHMLRPIENGFHVRDDRPRQKRRGHRGARQLFSAAEPAPRFRFCLTGIDCNLNIWQPRQNRSAGRQFPFAEQDILPQLGDKPHQQSKQQRRSCSSRVKLQDVWA